MTLKTKDQIAADIASRLPDNGSGRITPSVLRQQFTDIADSMGSGDADTASATAVAAATSATGSASAAATSATAATTQAGMAAVQAGIASAKAGLAATSADIARLASEAAGIVAYFDTYALANAALDGIAANAIVGVFVDETKGGLRTLYRKEGGALVFKVYLLFQRRTIYLDGIEGSDAAAGTSEATAVKTIAAANALLNVGDRLRINRGSRFPEDLNITAAHGRIDAYGWGEKPIIDGSRPISSGAWTADGSNAGVYIADVTHETASVAAGDTAGTTHFRLFQEKAGMQPTPLTPYWGGVDIAANRAYVAAHPGTFTCHRIGSTVADPRSDTAAAGFRYYANLVGTTNPASDGSTIYYAEHRKICNLTFGNTLKNVIIQRTAAKDLAGHNDNQTCLIEHVEFKDAAVHAWVGGANYMRFCKASALETSRTYSGGGFHGYHSTSVFGLSRGFIVEDCEATGFGLGVYSHGDGPAIDHATATVRRFIARDCGYALFGLAATTGWLIEDVQGLNCDNFYGGGNAFMKRVRYVGSDSATANRVALDLYGDVSVEDGEFILDPSQTLYHSTGAIFNNALFVTLTLNRVTRAGGFGLVGGNEFWKQVIVKASNCVLGEHVYSVSYPWAAGTTMTKTQISIPGKSLATLQTATPGIANDCVSGWVGQSYNRTIQAADIGYVATVRTATGVAAATTLTVNFIDSGTFFVGMAIKLGTFVTTVTAISGFNGSGTFTIADPVPTDGLTEVVIQRGYYQNPIFPEDAGTCVFSDDGTQAYFSRPELFSAGQTIYIGGLNRGAPIGVRTLTAFSGSIGTLNQAVVWQAISPTSAYSDFGATNKIPRPSYPVSFGFPLAFYPDGPSATLNKVVGTDLTGAEGNTSSCLFDGGFDRILASTGLASDYGQVKHERGYVDAGFGVAVGDALTVTATALVADNLAQFEGNPLLCGRAILRAGSRLAALGMGARL